MEFKMEYQRKNVKVRQIDGSYKWKCIYAKSKRELSAKIRAVQEDAEREYQNSIQPLFCDFADEWYEWHSKDVALYTAQGYIAPLKDLKEWFEGNYLHEIKPLMIQELLDYLFEHGYARQTIKLRLTTCKQIFDYAGLRELVTSNPASFAKVPKKAQKNARLLPSDEDIQKALDNVNEPFGLYFVFLYYTGCRRQEALALRYEDIDFENDLIHINKKLIFDNGRSFIENGAKSQNGVRSIPLVKPLKKLLTRRTGLIFQGKNGYYTKPEFDKAVARYKKSVGIEASSHQFRHAFATLCFDAGLTDKDAAEVIGHANIETTRNIYTHIKEQRRKEYAEKLNQVV